MISKKKLIEYLEKWVGCLGDSPSENAAEVILKAVIDKIRAFPKEDIPDANTGDKWIPVSERLPGANGVYSISDKAKDFVKEFYGNYATQEETYEIIKRKYEEENY